MVIRLPIEQYFYENWFDLWVQCSKTSLMISHTTTYIWKNYLETLLQGILHFVVGLLNKYITQKKKHIVKKNYQGRAINFFQLLLLWGCATPQVCVEKCPESSTSLYACLTIPLPNCAGKGSRKKVLFLVARPLRPLAPPPWLSGHRNFFPYIKNKDELSIGAVKKIK